jgi:GTP cyclohydrolase I
MINGSSPLVTQENRDARERENAFKSIKSSMGPKKEPVDLEGNYFQPHTSAQPRDKRPSRLANLDEAEARDPRDDWSSQQTSRASSPYTLAPTIDFDGLSWPSML